jgi:phosphoribosylanthranilate isomerase
VNAVRVKICGITSIEDALSATEAGADALGFVFFEKSPRYVSPAAARRIVEALPPLVQTVGLFVNDSAERVNRIVEECGIDVVQLHGDETPEAVREIRRRVMKAFRVRDLSSLEGLERYDVAAYLLDAYAPNLYGGTGLTFNWDIARRAGELGRIILAGGLTPENVARAVEEVRPFGVDVSGGVEKSPGRKDPEKVREFIRQAKGLDTDC